MKSADRLRYFVGSDHALGATVGLVALVQVRARTLRETAVACISFLVVVEGFGRGGLGGWFGSRGLLRVLGERIQVLSSFKCIETTIGILLRTEIISIRMVLHLGELEVILGPWNGLVDLDAPGTRDGPPSVVLR